MKFVTTAVIPFLALAVVPLSAIAQPLDITVRGGRIVTPDTAPRPIYNDDYVYGDRSNPRFDPAAAAINAINISHFYPPRNQSVSNIDRAATLERTGTSIVEHQLRCQAAHPTYELAGDTYLGPDGIPVPCRF